MELNLLKTFYHFGMILNVTETARHLYVTQSAVSHALKKLEASTGVPLIERSGRSCRLTEYGIMLHNTCRYIFSRLEQTEERLKNRTPDEPVHILLGAPVEFGSTILISNMTAFADAHPEFHINYVFSHRLFDRLLKDEVDLIVDCKYHVHPSVTSVFLCNEPYVVVASPRYIRENHISGISDINRVRILSLDEDAAWWENFFINVSSDIDITVKKPIVINHVRGLINAALSGMGISFVPRYTVRKELAKGTLEQIFSEAEARDDHFRIFIKEEKYELEKNRILTGYLKNMFTHLE